MIFVEHSTFAAQLSELLTSAQKKRVRQLVEEIKAEYKP